MSNPIFGIKVLVGPLVFKKNGQPSCGFGSDCRTVVIIEADEWKKLEGACKESEARVLELDAKVSAMAAAIKRISDLCLDEDQAELFRAIGAAVEIAMEVR